MLVISCAPNDNNDVAGTDIRDPYTPDIQIVYEDNDGEFEYKTTEIDNISEYVIIYPNGNDSNMKSAMVLKEFFKSSFDVDLQVLSDSQEEKNNEILVGNTNRPQSSKKYNENELSVFAQDGKIVFNGGHDVMIDSAVKKFVRASLSENKICLFDIKTDFVTEKLDGYKYVWGDEFEGSDLDFTKWSFRKSMNGTTKMEVSYDKNVIDVSDGRLKLRAIRFYNPDNPSTEYRVPYGVSSKENMNFTYGYMEVRCRLPFKTGAWPSFWALSTDTLKGKMSDVFRAEVDVIEVFGNTIVKPHVHKHYDSIKKDTFWGQFKSQSTWEFDPSDKLIYEYHTYGCEWTETEIKMYVDGKHYQTFDITTSYDDNPDMSGYHDPIYLLFNNHLITDDGWQPGTPVEKNTKELPMEYFIDYVRVYQKPGVGELYTSDKENVYADRK